MLLLLGGCCCFWGRLPLYCSLKKDNEKMPAAATNKNPSNPLHPNPVHHPRPPRQVDALLDRHGGEPPVMQYVLHQLMALGYGTISWRVVNSAGFGLPNRRKRVFIVASLHGDARDVLLTQVRWRWGWGMGGWMGRGWVGGWRREERRGAEPAAYSVRL